MVSLDPSDSSKGTMKIDNTEKRDTLIEIEKKYQKLWADAKVFEQNAPTTAEVPFGSVSATELRVQSPKYFATIAYPYMNGSLHVGHGFTISKAEFATGYAKLQGRRALFPLGFHCTGMAIKACADKLVREIDQFGQNFERFKDEEIDEEDQSALQPAEKSTDITKFRSKKSKASAKSVQAKYQFQIMLSQGIPIEEIHQFADPYHWVHTFPAIGIQDTSSFGLHIDWRRSFVTTDANPFYDSFTRWQMNRLKELGKIKSGWRYTIYSPKDKQACLDHDRSSGEGFAVQEYTGIKMRVLEWSEAAQQAIQIQSALPSDAKVFFVAATLRPETMYGQTCCFVGPGITYGLYQTTKNEFLLCTRRAARNMAFQGIFSEWGDYQTPKKLEVRGADLIGTLVDAPLSTHSKGVRVLPMDTVKEAKGTGVVTCVPSDSPDDYATVTELSKKFEYFGIREDWAKQASEILPIIETPTYGSLTAPSLVKQMTIVSPKDPKLPEAKDIAYKEGFYYGKMIYGDFIGLAVQEAKGRVRQQLIDLELAFNYGEPEGLVISRSSDECVAAYLHQWYLNYGTAENGGDGEWCAQVLKHLNSGDLNTFSPEAKRSFEKTLSWLGQWACARSYGLGSKLPWDTNLLVESLSDSTIYPAYYTVAHYLHADIYGKKPGLGAISAEQMTDSVWDYIFARTEKVDSDIPLATLQAMRREFEYWYPLDLRVSGKDLIQNHLSFFLYIHVAIWPSEFLPRGIRPNGHLLLNGEKMSKSTGNFLTLRETTKKFGADAARIALADAGDGIDDANFEESVGNKTILKLFELKKWLEDMLHVDDESGHHQSVTNTDGVKLRTGERNFWDNLFENELSRLVWQTKEQYDDHLFKGALRSGFYDLTSARDFYRDAMKAADVAMHRDLVRWYAELQALLLAPVAPHWAEYIWLEVLHHDQSIHHARWPVTAPASADSLATLDYIRKTTSSLIAAEAAQHKKLGKGKATSFDPKRSFRVRIFFTTSFPTWQDACMSLVSAELEKMGIVDTNALARRMDKKESKRAMPFIQGLKRRLEAGENKDAVLARNLLFDEEAVLGQLVPVLTKSLSKCEDIEVVEVVGGGEGSDLKARVVSTGETMANPPASAANAIPGSPSFHFENI